jgi:hypothetical protein
MSDISRRAWLKGLALFSVAPMMLVSTTAEAKVTKVAVHYLNRSGLNGYSKPSSSGPYMPA